MAQRFDRLESIPEEFINAVIELFPELSDYTISLLRRMEGVDTIALTPKNIAAINEIVDAAAAWVWDNGYKDALSGYAKEFSTQFKLINDTFSDIIGFEVKPVYKDIMRASQKRAVELLGESHITTAFKDPLKQTLLNNVANASTWQEATRDVRNLIEGNKDFDPALVGGQTKLFVRDSFVISDRNYAAAVGVDLGLEWCKYDGGLIKDSRPFCEKRAGKYFHINEVRAWGDIPEWQGRAKGTNPETITSLLGGYNCLHGLMWVTIANVPDEVIQRNIESGNYKP